MSKAGKMKMVKKIIEKVDHSSKLRTDIPAGMAKAAPPLGPMLGQRNINIPNFCKDFNERTQHIKEGVPLPCRAKVNPDRSYNLVIHKPPVTYFLKQAAGVQVGQMEKGDIAGKITLKHLYEIAKIKSEDPPLALMSLQQICIMIVGIARTVGIQIVREIDPKEYEEFLKERELKVEERRNQRRLIKESKLLRMG
ncbi:PREDICTED: 39S ribosomal protein L11, mitochondrial [Polistes dominula]|uniref:Large ribosomal subunit protein uL11m n=1 Tax=Polistes dominula TaxID=743375 RepID=A0ABM1HTD5_POLDO|nr:PREDICTED: 39S ribosomal protein L11, mitochondrial [Polistes dominula]